MLVTRTLANKELETRERIALMAFQYGAAQPCHYDDLRYMNNLLILAGQTDPSRHYIYHYANNVINPIMLSINERFLRTGKLGVNATELATLAQLIDVNKEFWMKQITQLFKWACIELDRFNAEQKGAI